MNRGKVRQPGAVVQRYLDVELIRRRKARVAPAVAVGRCRCRPRVAARHRFGPARRAPRPRRRPAPHDRHRRRIDALRVRGDPLPPAEVVIDAVLGAADGLDLVGLYAAGPMYRGFANSFGQRNWHETTTFNLQWSLYHRADKAVKSALSGFAWDERAFVAKMAEARRQLAHVADPGEDAGARQVPRLPDARRDGGDRGDALLGRVLGARARTRQSSSEPHAGRRRVAPRSARHDRRGDRRRRCAGVPGRGIRAAEAGAADRRRPSRRVAGVAADRARILPGRERRQRLRGARSAGDGGRHARRRRRARRRSAPASTSAISTISTTPIAPRAG